MLSALRRFFLGNEEASKWDWVRSILIAIGLALVFRWPVAEPFKIPSSSMEPTFLPGDRIFVDKHVYGVRWPFNGFRVPFTRKDLWYSEGRIVDAAPVKRWDMIVFKSVEPGVEHDILVKRVAALGGERVLIRGGKLYINGEPQEIPDFMPEVAYTQANFSNGYGLIPDDEHSLVPDGHVFLLGDNSAHSRDARWFGFLPEHHIIGRVTSVWWPVARWRDFTGYTRTWWWIGLWSLVAAYTLMRLLLGRFCKVYDSGLGQAVRRGEHLFIRYALGLSIPFTRTRVTPGRTLRRGEVVLYHPPREAKNAPELLLGIVAGLPEERVHIDDGRLLINDSPPEDAPNLVNMEIGGNGKTGRYGSSRSKEYAVVPEDSYFVLSAGEEGNHDSRSLGWISKRDVVGAATRVWWPLTRWRRLPGE